MYLGDEILVTLKAKPQYTRNVEHLAVVDALASYVEALSRWFEEDHPGELQSLRDRLQPVLDAYMQRIRNGRDAKDSDIASLIVRLDGVYDGMSDAQLQAIRDRKASIRAEKSATPQGALEVR
jgi:hypothetical protein